jgi:hypothetical protein
MAELLLRHYIESSEHRRMINYDIIMASIKVYYYQRFVLGI